MVYKTENVTVKAGRKFLINEISVDVKPGKFSVILGPNGAGKSTLLKIFSNDISPTSGQASLEGKPISQFDRSELAKTRAVLPQCSNVTFNFSVYDIVKLGRIPHNESDVASTHIIDRVMTLTNIAEFKNRQYRTLSGGERQRVQFARVLAQIWLDEGDTGSKYLLLDEPTSALDPLYQLEILKIASWLTKIKGVGVLAVLHDLNQAMAFADIVYLLKDGKLINSGSPEKVLTKNSIHSLWGIEAELVSHASSKTPSIIPIMTNYKLA